MKKAKTEVKPRGLSKAELKERLRYMNPKNIARDFKLEGERAAIKAVFQWLSLNGTCAMETRSGHYKTHLSVKDWNKYVHVLINSEAYEEAKKILVKG